MKKFSELLKRHRTIILICVLLITLIIAAVFLFDRKTETVTSYDSLTRTETESKLIRILSGIEGVGKSDVMITEANGGIEGVIIVCEGADNIMTRSNVLNVVTTALNVDKSNIAIYAMNK